MAVIVVAIQTKGAAALYNVNSYYTGGGDYSPAVKAAILAAYASSEETGTIYFPSGTTYTLYEAITPTYVFGAGTTTFAHSLTFQGDSEAGSVIVADNGGGGSALFDMALGDNILTVTFTNLTIQAGSAGNGTAIVVNTPSSGVTLSDSNNQIPNLVANTIAISNNGGDYFGEGISLGLSANDMINNCTFTGGSGATRAVGFDENACINTSIINSAVSDWEYGIQFNAAPYGQGVVINNCTMTNVQAGIYSGSLTSYWDFPMLTYIGNCTLTPAAPTGGGTVSGIYLADSEWSFMDNNDIYLQSGTGTGYGIWVNSAKEANMIQNSIMPYSGTISGDYGIKMDVSGSATESTYLNVLSGNAIGQICSGTAPIDIETVTYTQYDEYLYNAGYSESVPTQNQLSGNSIPAGSSVVDGNSSDQQH